MGPQRLLKLPAKMKVMDQPGVWMLSFGEQLKRSKIPRSISIGREMGGNFVNANQMISSIYMKPIQ
jgi:hypothetical protein